MPPVSPMLIAQSALTLTLVVVVTSALRVMMALERNHLMPLGARRVHSRLRAGDDFPLGYFAGALGRKLERGPALLLFGSATCGMCGPIVKSIPAFSKKYPECQFMLLSDQEWDPLGPTKRENISVFVSAPLLKELGLSVSPYAYFLREGRVAEFGVVNSPEHVESLLESKRGR
jgi:hypothetical protein